MRVTLLGTGDSTGTPTPGCDCDTCRAARDRGIERSRFSVHVENERTGASLLVDASPDFRRQFLDNDVSLPDAVLITHVHFDHLHGLGNAYRLFEDLDVYAAAPVDPATGESVADTIRDRYAYLDRITVRDLDPFEPAWICGLEVRIVPVDHPPLACYGLSIRDPETGAKLSISGDTTYAVPDHSREALRDPNLLLADAIVPASFCEHHPAGGAHHDADGVSRTFGTKHMTREGALALAGDLDAAETRLVHLSHFYDAAEAFGDPLAVDGEEHVLSATNP
jgi:phosphoribosyl 1,2-cyclic phosphate phosphodiesterase